MDGETASGIVLQHHEGLPVVYGRVLKTHPSCNVVRPGDWCLFEPERLDRLPTREGPIFCLSENAVVGVVEPGDGSPWFDVVD
jgi:hypothetical protein